MSPPLLFLLIALSWPARLPPPDPEACGFDAFERNYDRAHARRVSGVAADARTCAGDPDWFAVHLERGEDVRVGLLYDRGDALPPPTVFAPRQRRALGRAYSAPGESGVRLTAPAEGW